MKTFESYIRDHDTKPQRGNLIRKFRWSKLRFEYGRYYVILKPFARCRYIQWWQWEDTQTAIQNLSREFKND